MAGSEDAARTDVSAYPPIVYVHVPKTAGTTVAKFLDLCTPRGHNAAHFLLASRPSFLGVARKSDWISGHADREKFANHLVWLDRPVEYFSAVREPVSQLVSHLNFSFERYTRGNYHGLHNPLEQQVDAEVLSTDFTNPEAVIAFLTEYHAEYLNTQSMYVLGNDFDMITDDEIARRLCTYKYVARSDDLPTLYRAFGFAQLPERADELHENVARPRFNAEVFDSPQLRQFLADHHRHDLGLYAAVRRASWPAEKRRLFRPAFLACQVFTPENFDERTYLDSNQDVAIAVKQGQFDSGRAHFDAFGYKERRTMRRWVFPRASISKPKSTDADVPASAALDRLRELRAERARIAAELRLPQRDLVEEVPIAAVAKL